MRKLSATEAQNKTTKVTHTASVVMGTGSPVPHIAIPEETVGSPETPSRRLNPIAPTYTPDPPQSAQLAAQVRTNELRAQHTRQQAQQQAQVQRAYYEAQFHKAYRDGVVRGRHEGAQMTYDAGFSAGQRYANEVAAKRLISNTVTNTDNQMKADEGKGGSTSGV
jgi:flagellar biosynthesis/type III secretory pathway protein FliH